MLRGPLGRSVQGKGHCLHRSLLGSVQGPHRWRQDFSLGSPSLCVGCKAPWTAGRLRSCFLIPGPQTGSPHAAFSS